MNTAWSNGADHPAFMLTPWNQLKAMIKPDTPVRHWSRDWPRDNGFISGKAFTVVNVYPTYLDIVTASGTDLRLTQRAFEEVASQWSEYLAGELRRSGFKSQKTTYVFSLLRWFQDTLEVAHA